MILLEMSLGRPVAQADAERARSHVAVCAECWDRFRRLASDLAGAPTPMDEPESTVFFPGAPNFGEAWKVQRSVRDQVGERGVWRRGHDYLAYLRDETERRTLAVRFALQGMLGGPTLALAHRGDPAGREFEGTLSCTDLSDIEAVVAVTPDPSHPDLVRVSVEVALPDRWPDYSGVRVVLDDGMQRKELVSGQSGFVRFDSVERARLSDMSVLVIPGLDDAAPL